MISEGKSIPFVSYNERKGFELNPEAEDFLMNLPNRNLAVISIVGKYRTGKSYLINRVLLKGVAGPNNGFKVGPTINPCTKGLWLWKETLQPEGTDGDLNVLLIDTEGFGGIDEGSNHDSRIFLFSLLLSSFFVYNSVGTIDEGALQNLSLIVNLAKEIQVKKTTGSNSGGASALEMSEEEIAETFPSFLWVLRDFALQLKDSQGNRISSKDYLENALIPQKGISDAVEQKNRIRRMLRHFFHDRDCSTLVRPLENEKEMQKLEEVPDSSLRGEFLEQCSLLRKKIFKRLKPKSIQGHPVTGPMLVQLCKAYIEAINNGKVPNVESAWSYLCKKETQRAVEESQQLMEKVLTQSFEKNMSEREIHEMKRELKSQVSKIMSKSKAFEGGLTEEEIDSCMNDINKRLKERMKFFKMKNNEKWQEKLQKAASEPVEEIEEKIRSGELNSPEALKAEIQKMVSAIEGSFGEEFMSQPQTKELVEGIVRRIEAKGAEEISKRAHEELVKQKETNLRQIERLEAELRTRKSDNETEKSQLMEKISELERTRAVLQANDNSNREQLERLKEERGKSESELKGEVASLRSQLKEKEMEFRQKEEDYKRQIGQLQNEIFIHKSSAEKNDALASQELIFCKKELAMQSASVGELEDKCANLVANNNSLQNYIQELKKKILDTESAARAEILKTRSEYETTIMMVFAEAKLLLMKEWCLSLAEVDEGGHELKEGSGEKGAGVAQGEKNDGRAI